MTVNNGQPRHWIAVASRAHVQRGLSGGFMQVCHGKAAPLRRLQPGDRVAYYSPSEQMSGREPLRLFTAWGEVCEGEPYQFEMAPDFVPWRRDVDWQPAQEASILPLLPALEFVRGHKSWGAPLRWGLLPISGPDGELIAQAMGVDLRR